MVHRFAAPLGSFQVNFQVLLDLFLPDIVFQMLRRRLFSSLSAAVIPGCIIFAPYSAVSSCILYLLPAMLRKASLMISSTGNAASILETASAASLWLYPSDTSAAMA